MRAALACPLCSTRCAPMGPVYHAKPTHVAGVPIDLGTTRYELQRCPGCAFIFKNPPIPEDKLLGCYARADWKHWEARPDPIHRQFDVYRDLVAAHAPGRRILDIGCNNGAMLEYFGPEWDRYGVEPGKDAARVAGERGIRVLAEDIGGVPPEHRFDAVIAVDVAEHIAEPMPFFAAAAARLAPGGVLVIVTGDTGSLPWRTAGSRVWYAALVEHVSFYCERTMDAIGQALGMESVLHRHLSHARYGLGLKTSQVAKNALFLSLNRARGFGVPALQRRFIHHRAPGWVSSKDHFVHILKKP